MGEQIVGGIILAVLFVIVLTNPSGVNALGNNLTNFTTGTIGKLEVSKG